MAKISTYPGASGPQLSDKLIGTDTANGDATKNFTIGEILGLLDFSVYVPYIGAGQDVNLGTYGITAGTIVATDSLSVDNGFSVNSGTSEFYGPAQAYDEFAFDGQVKDSTGSPGTSGQVLTSTGGAIEWKDIHQLGSFYDSTTQTTTVGVAAAMKFSSEDIVGHGVTVTADLSSNKTQIQADQAGIYNVQFSAQVRNGAGAATIDIWFRKNGVDIPNSNTAVTLQSNSSSVAAWNYFVALVPGDKLQIMWTQDSNNLSLTAASAVAPHPATPSTILTVNRVR